MIEILKSPHQLPSSSRSVACVLLSPNDNDGLHQEINPNNEILINNYPSPHLTSVALYVEDTERGVVVQEEGGGGGCGSKVRERKRRKREEGDQLSLLPLLVAVLRKSLVACKCERVQDLSTSFSCYCSSSSSSVAAAAAMEIGWPTNVRHVAHVTFDRFNGFLGLPVEFEPEVPRRPPSASASVFGVSTESMQLSFDSRGNSVPTILLMMQRRLYLQGGLQTEGIFRINAENGQEEYVREQLNSGVVPDDIDVHCLAGLIKAWFRELPRGVLDSLSPEQVMQAHTEDECTQLVRYLPPTEAALLDWAINLMADVAEFEYLNKMNARNVAMVFAPNMTQMADPLTALMYAVQVMNFLKTLIVKTLKEREDSVLDLGLPLNSRPDDRDGHHTSLQSIMKRGDDVDEDDWQVPRETETFLKSSCCPTQDEPKACVLISAIENIIPGGQGHLDSDCNGEAPHEAEGINAGTGDSDVANKGTLSNDHNTITGQSSNSSNSKSGNKKVSGGKLVIRVTGHTNKSKEPSIFSRINSRTERFEAWL